jgi:hypothetical protein
MSLAFTKLFSSITESTVWCESDRTRLVWITMLAMADQFGRVMGSVPGLANRARVPVGDARVAIAAFLGPDPDSRTKDHEGRRIEEIDGGWRLLNHGKYRDIRSVQDRKEQNRLAQARARARRKAAPSSTVSNSQQSQPRSAQAEAEAEAEAKERESASRSPRASRLPAPFVLDAAWREWAVAERPDLDPDRTAAKFADYWHAKPGKDGRKLDWLMTWRNWVRDERAPKPNPADVARVTVPGPPPSTFLAEHAAHLAAVEADRIARRARQRAREPSP